MSIWSKPTKGEQLFICVGLGSLMLALVVLLMLLGSLLFDGASRLSIDFLVSFPSRFAERAGIYTAWVGSVVLIVFTALLAIPLGIATAVYLEEYARKSRLNRVIEVNITTLAGIPSIIYGLLGLQLFVRFMMLGRSILAAALTLALLVLPIIITVAREAIRQVPTSIREASLALGASRWQTVQHHVLPAALPGIMTGCILALSRAIGESAPLIAIGAYAYVAFLPESPLSQFTALPIQAFNWISRPQPEFHQNAAAAILVLLCILIVSNSVAIWIRQRTRLKVR